MIIFYIILVCLILFLLILTIAFFIYQKKLAKVAFKESFTDSLDFIAEDVNQVDSSYNVPEIISSSLLEDTSDI